MDLSQYSSEDLINLKAEIAEEVKRRYVSELTDKSISLESRWETFLDISNNGLYKNVKIYLLDRNKAPLFTNKFDPSELIENWYYDKHEHVFFSELEDRLDENESIHLLTDEMKEEILASGYTGFTLDW